MNITKSLNITQELLARQLNYWKQQLAGANPLLELPTDRSRPAVQTYQIESKSFILPSTLSDGLAQLCRQEGVTLYTLLLAAFVTLLYRYSKQEDIIIGSAIGEGNQVAIRTDLSGNPYFQELLTRVNSVTLDAHQHQDLPLEKLLAELYPERSLSYHPLFQVLFSLQNAAGESTSHAAIFDLTLSMQDKGGVISGTWNYSTDLFDDATITRMMENFQTLLAGIVADTQQPILQLSLLTNAQTQQLLEQGNNTYSEYPQDKCIHQLFEAQVSKTPDNIAVVFENQQLTYQQLNSKANQLAHHLQTLGVKSDTLVGIYVERSLEMVVGLLGILKAGGAYVPLDPAYPQERIALMLEDSQAPVIVTQSHLQAGLPQTSAQVVCLDSDWQIISQESPSNLAISSQPENLAYTIYTSGSTGKPKGVQIIQQAVVNFLTSMQHQPGISAEDVLLAVTTISFDIAVLELFLPITIGAKAVIVSRQTAADPIELMQVIAQSQATIMQATPATWRMLLTANWQGKPDLKILCGGEAMPRSLANQLLERTAALWNMYGPTETTIWSTVNCITPGDGVIDIGCAIANTKIYIIDSNAYNYGSVELVPIGVPGELLIGGVGLARGYLNRPELTQEKFIQDPFSNDPGERLYRTGDLARYLADGRIELIGRIDYQVKIRGFRIELGEIETLLNQYQAIQQAVVVAREDVPGDKRLVAYAIAKSIVPTTSELRAFLKEQLPEYMVPSVFVFLDAMPLTPNGKVDRRALPAPEQSSISLDKEFCPPSNPTEELLANIWSQVLGREKIGINDNFFELGGHSLLATQIISRSRQAFSVEILLNTLLENPTIATLAAKITQEQNKGVNLGAYQAIPSSENRNFAPLSFAQEPLWLLDQIKPNNSIYNLPVAVRLQGELNLPVLQQALDAIALLHEAVRTNFIAENGIPKQLINPPQPVELKIIDIQEFGEAERESQIAQLLEQESERPFNLESDLMLRGCLLKLAPQEQILLLVMHHIASDGWSISVLWQQLNELYQAFLNEQPHPLPTLPIQYADYATWEKAWLTDEVLEQQLTYWKQQLAGANPLLELPTDRPRPAVQTYQCTSQLLTIPASLSDGLQQICRQEGVTLYMVLLAAFQTLLYRYSKQTDIIVGSPFAGRNRVEVESLIGFFLKTLVIRTDLSGNPSFQELLKRVRSVTLDAYAHQDLPFEKLVEELHPQRSRSYHSLFQVMFILQNLPAQPDEIFGCTTTPINIGEEKLFDLTLSMEEIDGVLMGKWHYNTDLFDDATITRMMGHYQTLLSGIIADLQQPIAQLPLLTVAETQQLLGSGNNLCRDYSQCQYIYELFVAQVERTPNAIAVEYAGEQLTYRELNNKANQLAHYLRSLGVEVNQLVGIALQRSLDMIVGIFAILKAGAAYLPLDPTYPAERLAYMVNDAQVSLIVSHNQWLSQLPFAQAEVICLDSDWQEKIAGCSQENPSKVNTGEDLAYVIYTSGSTGKPKGVTITHKSLSVFTQTAITEYEITASDRVLQFASLNFDAAVEEIYPCLCVGGTLVLRSDEMLADLPTFFQACRELQLTVLDLPTAYWHQLAGELKNTDVSLPESLRLTIIGGEKVLAEPVRRWQQYVAQSTNSDRLKLVNTYGPTETTVTATVYTIPNSSEAIAGEVPIGRPLAHLQAYILDSDQQPVPIGIAGELYIGGETLAKGYLNREEITSEKFIANPFSQQPQARLYRTGDLARYLPDGNIEFLGRIDNQVKIRGFRIELGEIEARLAQHHSIQETVVIARSDRPGEKSLAAYIVAQPEPPQSSELRSFLLEQLPNYMVPSAFVFLDTMPLTPNGKVDYRALPVPEQFSISLDTEFCAPRSFTEEVLVNIWSQVLGREQIGINDNFFELGGHSLLATQVISRIRQAFGVEMKLQTLLEQPTVKALAIQISQYRNNAINLTKYQQIPQRANRDRAPLSFSQQGLWLLEQIEPNSYIYNIPFAVSLQGELNLPALQQALDAVVARHEALRSNFIVEDGSPRQVINQPKPVELTIIDIQQFGIAQDQNQIKQLLEQESQRPFNLTTDLMLKGTLFQLAPQEHILLLVMHHIAADGWSFGVLWEQLGELYKAFLRDRPNPLPELAIQYADYAVWQREQLTGEVLEQQLNYWKQQLAGATPLLELPTDRPRPAVQTYQGASQLLILSPSLSDAIKHLCHQEGVTLYMLLLAAFVTLLHRYSKQEDIVIGSAIAGRNRVEIENLIGYFINNLVIRTDLSGNPRFPDLLAQVRAVTLDAYAHQDLPFEKLLEELRLKRSLSYNSLFQVMFILQNAPSEHEGQLLGVTSTRIDLDKTKAIFDLTVSMEEKNGVIIGTWNYKTDLFDDATITRMMEQYQTLLAGIVDNPQQPISQLPLLTDAQTQYLLEQGNNTESEYPQDKCIHQLFETQVSKTPDNIAVVYENQQLTYQQLNSKANQLAHHLQTLGVKSDTLVGIYVERSLEMVVGLLGILKAGGAYVPLDPAYPQERIALMLADSQAPVIVTQSHLQAGLPQTSAQVICLDSDWQIISQQSSSNLAISSQPENLAYTIYTSGSTGKPKGVQIIQQAVVNFLTSMQHQPGISAEDVLLAVTTISFDIAVLELFLPITIGAKAVIVSRQTAADPIELMQVIAQSQATIMQATPATWRMLLTANWQGKPDLKILCGGEAMPRSLANQLLERTAALWNMYGPTETTIWSTVNCITPGDGVIDIGCAIANTKIYIIDSNAYNYGSVELVPVGVPGELLIGGVGLARGYLNRPELTQEKFIQDPFSNDPGERLYRTGDLARYLPDGRIELIGRIDYQVKIRGFRIELGEIETLLNQYQAIQQAVVVAREDVPGDKRLVAYAIAKSIVPTTSELRTFLKEQLPEYMVPSVFVFLDTLPLTANGKVDRRALPAPDQSHVDTEKTFVAPRDNLEAQLTRIWEEILNVQSIGVTENFFDLGGHSLLAVRMMAQIEKILHHKLPLAAMFPTPTIEQLAKTLRQKGWSSSWYSIVPIQPKGSRSPLFGVHSTRYHTLANYLGEEQPVYALRYGLAVENGENMPDLPEKMEDLAAHYIKEMRIIQPQGPYYLMGLCIESVIAFEMAQQLTAQGEKVAMLALFDPIIEEGVKPLSWQNKLANLFKIGLGEVIKRAKKNLFKKIINHNNTQPRNKAQVKYQDYVFQPYAGKAFIFNPVDHISLSYDYEPDLGWGQFVTGGLEIHDITGVHSEIFQEPHVQVVAEKLNHCLEKIREEQSQK